MAIWNTVVRTALAAVVTAGVGVATASANGDVRLQGAGATFPNPLYKRWVADYEKVNPQVKIDYQSIGSGGGVKGITDKTVHFAGSDAPLNKKELEALGGADKVVQVPTCAGAIVPAYNLPDVKEELKFTGDVLAQIFLGKISKWNDPKIAELNAGVKLPDSAITPVYRTDGSGTTFVFTNYLATQSEAFKSTIGTGKQVTWTVGQGNKGNEGVAAVVKQTPGSLGYIELNYAVQNKIAFGSMKNQAGKFVKASPETVSAAGDAAAKKLTGNVLAADIWNQPGDQSYPISSFTYLIIYRDLNNVKTQQEADALMGFLTWALQAGQGATKEMDYAPLSKGVQQASLAALGGVTFNGKPLSAGGH